MTSFNHLNISVCLICIVKDYVKEEIPTYYTSNFVLKFFLKGTKHLITLIDEQFVLLVFK